MTHYIDLSHPVTNGMPCYDGDPQVSLQQISSVATEGYSNFVLSTGMHSGTHLDGPMHLTSSIKRIADIPLDQFTGPGFLVNAVGHKIIDLQDSDFDHILPGSIALFYTGFDLCYNQKEYFSSYPVLSKKTALLLVEKKVKMIGMDSPSPDYAPYHIHSILLSNDILIIENLMNLSSLLPYRDFEILAFPLKIQADSSPVRVAARITK
jgi:kynurenine formamidase